MHADRTTAVRSLTKIGSLEPRSLDWKGKSDYGPPSQTAIGSVYLKLRSFEVEILREESILPRIIEGDARSNDSHLARLASLSLLPNEPLWKYNSGVAFHSCYRVPEGFDFHVQNLRH